MATEESQRLHDAVTFLKRNGYVKTDLEIARKTGMLPSTLNMCIKGRRRPTTDQLLSISDNYPINFWWLRSGEGDMVGGSVREFSLLKRIQELEEKIRKIEGEPA